MSNSHASALAPRIKRLIWLSAVATLFVAGCYVYKFTYTSGEWFVLSASKQEWGTFGDYFGGLLGTFFSFLAFLGVLFTVNLQARQLDAMRQQAGHEEMQRAQAGIAQAIDAILAAEFKLPETIHGVVSTSRTTLREKLTELGTHLLQEPPEDDEKHKEWLWADVNYRDLKLALDSQTKQLRVEFDSMSWMLTEYRKANGSETVLDYYKHRYFTPLVALNALGFLISFNRVREHFELDQFKRAQ